MCRSGNNKVMGSKGQSKYDYGRNGGKDVYGVDAPDFRDADDWGDLLLAITGVTLLFIGEIGTRQIKEQMCGWMPQGRERQRYENRIATALVTLEAGRILESYGVQWVRYRKVTEPYKAPEVVIDPIKAKEYKEAQREYWAAYATGGYELQERA